MQKKLHLNERYTKLTDERMVMTLINTGSALKYVFKLDRSAHIFGKKLTEKAHFGLITLVNGFLASIRLDRK